MKKMLSKSRFVGGWQCEKQAYLTANHPKLATPFSAATMARFAGGTRFGELARAYWSDGVLIDSPAFKHDAAVDWTREVIQERRFSTIFEAGFTELGTRVRADVMSYNESTSAWDLVEVKSSSAPKRVHDVDMAIQRAVIEKAGVSVGTTSLMLVNTNYVRTSDAIDPKGLFKIVDRTEQVLELLPEITRMNSRLHDVIDSDQLPDIKIGPHCEEPYECQFFEHCTKDRPWNWIRYIPGFGLKKTVEFESSHVFGIDEIPDREQLNSLQSRAVDSVNAGRPWISDSISEAIEQIEYPLRFIDFETISPTVPVFIGTSPREVIPFQWSCHTLRENGLLGHRDYLADGSNDPRREFLKTLLRETGTEGSVLVYSGYEQTTLKRLAKLFPDLEPEIESLILRFVDLLKIVKDNYYHPGFRGSFSIKNVLPVMVPGYDYHDLSIADGESASATFIDIVEGRVDEDLMDDVYEDLLEYCKRDTEAMVRIWRRLDSLCSER